jgi:hypothetical protein
MKKFILVLICMLFVCAVSRAVNMSTDSGFVEYVDYNADTSPTGILSISFAPSNITFNDGSILSIAGSAKVYSQFSYADGDNWYFTSIQQVKFRPGSFDFYIAGSILGAPSNIGTTGLLLDGDRLNLTYNTVANVITGSFLFNHGDIASALTDNIGSFELTPYFGDGSALPSSPSLAWNSSGLSGDIGIDAPPAVPEPSTLMMLGMGLIGIFGKAIRKYLKA